MPLRITRRVQGPAEYKATLTLPFELRQKSRLLTRLDDGEEIGLLLPRGTVLRHGDLLCIEDGRVARVIAAPEDVSTAATTEPPRLARACYHLGNRHVPVQIDDAWLRYRYDYVLDAMVEALGLEVIRERAPFEPETGAYEARHLRGR
jgi:urease accessory protein